MRCLQLDFNSVKCFLDSCQEFSQVHDRCLQGMFGFNCAVTTYTIQHYTSDIDFAARQRKLAILNVGSLTSLSAMKLPKYSYKEPGALGTKDFWGPEKSFDFIKSHVNKSNINVYNVIL